MAKKQIRLSESDLKTIIRESVVKYLTENADEVLDTPERAIHYAHAATADKKNHPGRGKDSKDPAIRARRDRQTKAGGEKAADMINQEMGDPDSMVIGDRGARRMMVASGPYSAYLTNDLEDIDSAKVYNDNFKDGDEPMAIADLKEINPELYAKIHKNFATFKGYHDRAKELDDQYLEEAVSRVLRRTLTEGNFGIDPAAKTLYVAGEKDGGVIAFDPRTKRKAFIPAEEILSNNPEDIIRVSAGTFAKYFGLNESKKKLNEMAEGDITAKAKEVYQNVDWDDYEIDDVDGGYATGTVMGKAEDENGGVWEFVGSAGFNWEGDWVLDAVEDAYFTSPDGQEGWI